MSGVAAQPANFCGKHCNVIASVTIQVRFLKLCMHCIASLCLSDLALNSALCFVVVVVVVCVCVD